MNPILTILFILQITQIISDSTVSYCQLENSSCLINGPLRYCSSETAPSTYQGLEELFSSNYQKYNIINIDQIQCGKDYEECTSISPEDIKDKCYNVSLSSGQCCYMKLKYQYNTKYGCYPIERNKKTIKDKIKELKKYYVGVKKISIKCDDGFYVKSNYFLFFIFLFILNYF